MKFQLLADIIAFVLGKQAVRLKCSSVPHAMLPGSGGTLCGIFMASDVQLAIGAHRKQDRTRNNPSLNITSGCVGELAC